MGNSDLKRRLAALLSADVVGYSRLMAQDELGTIRTLTAYRAEMTAQIYLLQKDHANALAEAERALLARPNCDGSYVAKANVLNYLGRPAESIELAKYAMRLTPVYPVYYPAVLAAAYYGCRRYEDAIAAAREVLQSDGNNLDALLILAGANAALDRIDAARKASNEVIRVSPDFTLDKYAATQPYSDPQDLEQVIEMLQKAGLE